MCGKPEETADLQDLLIYVCKRISVYGEMLKEMGTVDKQAAHFICKALFTTITNVAWDDDVLIDRIKEGLKVRDEIKKKVGTALSGTLQDCVTWSSGDKKEIIDKAMSDEVRITAAQNEDVRSLRELLIIGCKGIAAYADHAAILGYEKDDIYGFLMEALASTTKDLSVEEFESFNGPIILTTNCLIPIKKDNTYLGRLFTTGVVNYPGAKHIADRPVGGAKDFSQAIALAKTCKPPQEIESGTIVGGFTHNQVLALADKVIDAVKSGAIKRFVVMAGCDGRQKARSYFTGVAENLPKDMVILTAGCAKYRYNKLDLGDIGGIPRVLDAGQCNDSYSLAVIALKLKEAFGLKDINELPISYDIAWYEQKAVAVLLALLFLGVKGMRLGPTLPAFLSPAVAKVLVEKFDIKPIGTVQEDIAAMMTGK